LVSALGGELTLALQNEALTNILSPVRELSGIKPFQRVFPAIGPGPVQDGSGIRAALCGTLQGLTIQFGFSIQRRPPFRSVR